MDHKIILVSNKLGDITHIQVSNEDYEELNKFKWNILGKYVSGRIDKKMWTMHRYIMIKNLNNDIDSKTPVDHINGIKTDNRRCNLRIATLSENARNIKKKEGCSSKYMGVSYHIHSKRWQTSIVINKKTIMAYYYNEHWAGHQYNLFCKEYNLHTANLNIIPEEELIDFQLYVRKSTRPSKNIDLTKGGKYNVRICSKHIGTYETLEEAIKIRDIEENKKKELEINKINNTPIKYNKDGECIIEIFNKHKIKVCETIIDEDIYYDLIKHNWNLDEHIRNRKLGYLHRYILNYTGDDVVDHIDNNVLNNKKSNLRICTKHQNNMNKSSFKNSTSKFVGVHYRKNDKKWVARICKNGINKNIGYYETEIDAAKARDEEAILHFGEFANLNLN
jgi:hypothetical protein